MCLKTACHCLCHVDDLVACLTQCGIGSSNHAIKGSLCLAIDGSELGSDSSLAIGCDGHMGSSASGNRGEELLEDAIGQREVGGVNGVLDYTTIGDGFGSGVTEKCDADVHLHNCEFQTRHNNLIEIIVSGHVGDVSASGEGVFNEGVFDICPAEFFCNLPSGDIPSLFLGGDCIISPFRVATSTLKTYQAKLTYET